MKSVLFLIADDWSPLARCYGDPVIHTPNIDALAERGITFDHAFCTTPSCAPSRATILTGLHSHKHGQYGHTHGRHTFRTLPELPTLPRLLRAAGVFCGMIGKQHTYPREVYPWDYDRGDSSPDRIDHRDPMAVAGAVREFLGRAEGKPFYLHVGFPTPHREPDGFGNSVVLPGVEKRIYSPDEVPVPGFLPDLPPVRDDLADYYQAVSRFDFAVGRVVAELERSGRGEETLIVLTSDHGMPFPGAKASFYDSGHRCPLVVVPPGGKPAIERSPALVGWTDYLPSFCQWFGVPVPEECHGRSFLPVLETREPEGWEEVFLSHTFHGVTEFFPYRIIRSREWKYVLLLYPGLTAPIPIDIYRSPSWQAIETDRVAKMGSRATADFLHPPEEQLFHVARDPLETRNLAGDPAHGDRLQSFRGKMQGYREETDDFWLGPWAQRHLRDWR